MSSSKVAAKAMNDDIDDDQAETEDKPTKDHVTATEASEASSDAKARSNPATASSTDDSELVRLLESNVESEGKHDDDQKALPATKQDHAVPSVKDDDSQSNVVDNTKPLSKKQLKRQRKAEMIKEKKRLKREREKAIRDAKAKEEGRDLDAERAEAERRRLDGTGRAKRNQAWLDRFEKNSSKFQIVIDCSFEQQMMAQEINSLALQLRYCYATNKRVDHPVKVTVTSLSGQTLSILRDASGFDQWSNRAFHYTDKDLVDAFPDKSRLVYLTSDATTTLEKLEDDKIYIIGGIVDRNRLKRVAIDRAEQLGIQTAKLPIGNFVDMTATKVLTTNHVFDLLVKHRSHNFDWKATFLDVLPHRKDVNAKDDTNKGSNH